MFQRAGHSVTPRLVAHVTVLGAHGFLDHWNGVVRRGDTPGKLAGEHRQVIQMIPGRENTIARDAQLTRNLGQRSSFVVTGVAKARVNVVAHDRQRRHAAAILIEVLLDGIGVLIVLSDQAERRKGGVMTEACSG